MILEFVIIIISFLDLGKHTITFVVFRRGYAARRAMDLARTLLPFQSPENIELEGWGEEDRCFHEADEYVTTGHQVAQLVKRLRLSEFYAQLELVLLD